MHNCLAWQVLQHVRHTSPHFCMSQFAAECVFVTELCVTVEALKQLSSVVGKFRPEVSTCFAPALWKLQVSVPLFHTSGSTCIAGASHSSTWEAVLHLTLAVGTARSPGKHSHSSPLWFRKSTRGSSMCTAVPPSLAGVPNVLECTICSPHQQGCAMMYPSSRDGQ